jgi:hypothetical protein
VTGGMLVLDISSAADSTDPSMAPSRCLSAEERGAPADLNRVAASCQSAIASARPGTSRPTAKHDNPSGVTEP